MADPMTLAQEFAALNEATRKAHEAIADMRTERRLMAEQLAAARTLLAVDVDGLLNAEVKRQVDALGEATKKAMADSVAKVSSEIDRYLELSLGADAYSKLQGKQSIPEIFAAKRRAEHA